MAVLTRARQQRFVQSGLIGAAIFAAAVAIIPIVCGALGLFDTNGGTRTAFASAPPGQYAVVARTEGNDDVLAIIAPGSSAAPAEIARVPHLAGFGVRGAVSPDGSIVAVVAVTSGTPDNPIGSLIAVDLATGKSTSLLTGIDPQQTPVWDPSSKAIVVSRDSGAGPVTVDFLRVPVDGSSPTTLDSVSSVLGAYAVGFDPQGRFVDVAIDGTGSTVRRAGQPLRLISSQITRDWQLSPDGTQLAFIESNLDGGLHYLGQTVSLDGAPLSRAETQTAPGPQQLGVAWQPGASHATFGEDPSQQAGQSHIEGQLAGDGFDVPIAYSHNGAALAIQHWSGSSFSHAGQSTLELVDGSSRTQVTGYSRFLGWTSR